MTLRLGEVEGARVLRDGVPVGRVAGVRLSPTARHVAGVDLVLEGSGDERFVPWAYVRPRSQRALELATLADEPDLLSRMLGATPRAGRHELANASIDAGGELRYDARGPH